MSDKSRNNLIYHFPDIYVKNNDENHWNTKQNSQNCKMQFIICEIPNNEFSFLNWIPIIITALIAGGALIRVEIIRKDIGKKLFIHELQFRKEFEAYEQLWELLIEFRNTVASMRPMMDRIPEDKTEKEELMSKRRETAWISYNKVITEYWKQKPFFSPKVFNIINEVLKIGAKETVHFERMVFYKKKPDDYLEAEKHLEEIAEHLDKIDEAIRNSIQFPK